MRFVVECPICSKELDVDAATARSVRVPDHEGDSLMRPCPGVGRVPVKLRPAED